MKTFISILVTSALLAGAGTSAFAQTADQKINYRDLPKEVQKKLHSKKDDIKHIEQFNFNGKTVYEVRLDTLDSPSFVYFNQDGTRVNDRGLRLQRQDARKNLHLKNLPQTVQKTFKRETGSSKIEDIDVDTSNGRTVYDIDYLANGRTETIRINDDGSVNRKGRASRGERTPGENRRNAETVERFDRPLAATQKVNFENVPEPVKKTVRDMAGSNRIEDAERGTLDGRTVYEIAFKENGVHNEVRLAENGSVIQHVSGNNIGLPGKLSINEVPAPVRRAIRDQVGNGEVNDIDQKVVNGKTVYEVGFKRHSGDRQHELQIAEDGTVLGEPAGSSNK